VQQTRHKDKITILFNDLISGANMKRVVFAGLIALALASNAARAADMAVKAPPPPTPVAVSSWTGCYLNAGVGYGMWSQDHYIETFPGLVPITSTTDVGGRGWLGRLGGGCDYQVGSRAVIGALADYDFMDLKGTLEENGPAHADEKEDSAWAVGARLGYLINPTLLTYVSGGYTQTRFDQLTFSLSIAPFPLTGSAAAANTYQGWFIGGGVEYDLGWLPGLFWRTEYRYSSYRATNVPEFLTATGAPNGVADGMQKQVQTVTTSLVWRFNWTGTPSSSNTTPQMPVKAPVLAVPTYNWTGCYADAGVGYGMWNQEHYLENFPPPSPVSSTTTSEGQGWLGRLGGGCDYQIGSRFVIGALADYDFMDLKGRVQILGNADASETEQSAWAGGGRIGYLINPTLLTYASGGYTESRFGQLSFDSSTAPFAPVGLTLAPNTYRGWFIGGGAEFNLGWLPGLFWRTEYRYSSYQAADVPYTPAGIAEHIQTQVQTATTGLVWHFNGTIR
jgi:outer membrane immunogenic protein